VSVDLVGGPQKLDNVSDRLEKRFKSAVGTKLG
jgi:hypothetical protein